MHEEFAVNREHVNSGGIFKLCEQMVLSTSATFIYIPINVVLIMNYSYLCIKAVIISDIKTSLKTLFFSLTYIVLPTVCQSHSYFHVFLIGRIEKV